MKRYVVPAVSAWVILLSVSACAGLESFHFKGEIDADSSQKEEPVKPKQEEELVEF